MDKSTDGLASSASAKDVQMYGSNDIESVSSSEGENARGTWGGKIEFLLSCVGYAVGLGNVWRFPFLAYRNGGGAFLIPYAIMLLIIGIPLFFMELAFGQFSSLGPISMWKAVPLFKGVGWAMVTVSFMVGLYYNMIIAWTLYYFFASMTSVLPWQNCGESWNTPLCAAVRGSGSGGELTLHSFGNGYTAKNLNQSHLNSSWIEGLGDVNKTNYFDKYDVKCWSQSNDVMCNLTSYPIKHLFGHFGLQLVSPAEEYWNNRVLRRSDTIENSGEVLWDLALCLLLAWIIVCLCLIKGVKSSGKVVYFTATFPYIVLTILLIRGALLDGAYEGITFYIVPDFSKLADAAVWKDAATQIFYSLGVGFGGLQVMSSFNKFHNNCLADALTVAFINCGTSVYAGFAIFSMIGFLAKKTGVPVQDAATSGPGLAFIAYPEGITQMPVAPLWSLLFFFMLFTLGLDSQFAMVEAIISGLTDEFPVLTDGKWKLGRVTITRKMVFTVALCFFMFLLGLPMATRGGIYWFNILDWYSASHCLLVIVFFECIGLAYVYGIKNFLRDIELMLGHKHIGHWMYFIVCWLVLSPLAILFILVFASVDYTPVYYEDYVLPKWAESIGWLVALSSMLMIPAVAVITYCRRSNHYQYIVLASKPGDGWGPALAEDRLNTVYERPKSIEENGETRLEEPNGKSLANYNSNNSAYSSTQM